MAAVSRRVAAAMVSKLAPGNRESASALCGSGRPFLFCSGSRAPRSPNMATLSVRHCSTAETTQSASREAQNPPFTPRARLQSARGDIPPPAFTTLMPSQSMSPDADPRANEVLCSALDAAMKRAVVDYNHASSPRLQDHPSIAPFTVLSDLPHDDYVLLARTLGKEHIEVKFTHLFISTDYFEYSDDEESNLSESELSKSPELSNEEKNEKVNDGNGSDNEDEHDDPIVRFSVTVTKSNSRVMKINGLGCKKSFSFLKIEAGKELTNAEFQHDEAKSRVVNSELSAEVSTVQVSNFISKAIAKNLKKYLVSRGIAPELSAHMSSYLKYKYEKNYIRRLENMKDFVRAD